MQIIITEKPSVGRDIAGVLGGFTKKDGYLESSTYIISWAFGHLVELAYPQDYDKKLAKWSLEQLPIIPTEFKFKPTKSGAQQLKILKKLLNSKKITGIINACDAGREGELIFRRVYQHCKCSKPIKRLWLSETTPAAVKKAFSQLLPGKDFANLAAAAEARSQADWLVGLNATRAFTVKHNTVLTVGRVQTPTLAMIVTREKEIQSFTPVPYWEVMVDFTTNQGSGYLGKWFTGNNDRLFSKEELDTVLAKIKNTATGTITGVEQKEKTEQPPTLFNLNDLQKEANRQYGMTAQQTLDTTQALYETHKALTYPRTDSRHLTKALAGTLPSRLTAVSKLTEYTGLIPATLPELGKRYINDSKVTDHHAIIPTDRVPTRREGGAKISNLNKNEQQVYDLVVRRFLAIFHQPAKYAVTKVVTNINDESFISKGKVELDKGWKKVYQNEKPATQEEKIEEEEQQLPKLTQDEMVSVENIKTPEKQTKPPKRHTEATLLSAMENAGKKVTKKELADTLKQAGGIGTPATRAAIIEKLINVKYIERQKKLLVPTKKGETLISLVPEQVKSVAMTADWEDGLRKIEDGSNDAQVWLNNIVIFTKETVQIAKNQESSNIAMESKTAIGKCPVCGKNIVESKKSFGCVGWKEGCKFVIWKEIAKKKLSINQVKTLLTKQKTGKLKGFMSKKGKKFDAVLILKNNKVEFSFA
ncbi:DNA topoisomerase 3 [Peptococcaceae bacterium]|nr:DNA topoisomerase 3 [Peptococcaceae bacterium]